MKNIEIKGNVKGDFVKAYNAAYDEARKNLGDDAIMWSFLDGETGVHSPPHVDCCGDDCGRPAWEVYAKERGGNLKVTLDKRYEFFFGPAPF